MSASVAIPAVRQNRSKLAPTSCQASSTIAAGITPAGVLDFTMALLSFVDSAPRAYRLKVGNAYLTFSTSAGTSPPLVASWRVGRASELRAENKREAHQENDKGASCPNRLLLNAKRLTPIHA